MIALYVLGAVLVSLILVAVLAPLREEEPPDVPIEDLPPDERHRAALETLRDLEFEYRTDKLPEEEYRSLKVRYGRILLEAEEAMDGGGEGREATTPDPAAGTRRGSEAAPDAAAATGDGAGTRGDGTVRCPWCEREIPASARFCPGCGARQSGRHA